MRVVAASAIRTSAASRFGEQGGGVSRLQGLAHPPRTPIPAVAAAAHPVKQGGGIVHCLRQVGW